MESPTPLAINARGELYFLYSMFCKMGGLYSLFHCLQPESETDEKDGVNVQSNVDIFKTTVCCYRGEGGNRQDVYNIVDKSTSRNVRSRHRTFTPRTMDVA